VTIGLGLLTSACQRVVARNTTPLADAKKSGAADTRLEFTPPPRTIDDVLALLHAPDDSRLRAAARAEADSAPPVDAGSQVLADFYYKRAGAAELAGRGGQQIADLTLALRFGWQTLSPVRATLWSLAVAERESGNHFRYLEYLRQALRFVSAAYSGELASSTGTIAVRAFLAAGYVEIGEVSRARPFLEVAEGRWRAADQSARWDALILSAQAALANVTGEHAEAEALYRKVLQRETQQTKLNEARGLLAEVLVRQDRLLEAESEARRATLGALASRGRDSPHTAWMLRRLAWVLLEQGRYSEAETLARIAIEIFEEVDTAQDSLRLASARADLARALEGLGRDEESLREYETIRASLGRHPQSLEHFLGAHVGYAELLLKTGSTDQALGKLTAALERTRSLVGDSHRETAEIRGALARGYATKGNIEVALQEFRRAAAALSTSAPAGEVEARRPPAGDRRLGVLSSYISLLADIKGTRHESDAGIDATAEAFRLAGVVRGRAIQYALDASAARAAAHTPALAELVRQKQDTRRQMRALYDQLGEAFYEGDAMLVRELRTRLEHSRSLLHTLAARVEAEFPAYGELAEPKPVPLDKARALLRPGEALITTLTISDRSFVWAVPHTGPVAFAAPPIGALKMELMVAALRKALEPNAKTVGDVPDFDLALAHDLYEAILEPVRSGWSPARSLIVVAHGPLAQLPLALLPTRRATLPPESGALFSRYRNVPWLVRTHAVTMLPSVGSLATLRALPAGDASRRPFAGFGDPWFSAEQSAVASTGSSTLQREADALVTRSAPITFRSSRRAVDARQLRRLPPLPDTAEEIQSIAAAAHADLGRDVFLGARANEDIVKTADLGRYRVIAFATHGLVPGDLPGLTQPALALSAPDVAGIDGDGLLTMDEILALRLNADWIVLSACSTASVEKADAGGLSGLDSAFFYAGARSLLVSNWPVETTSARALTTRVFRQSPSFSRAEALRATMTWMIDQAVLTDEESRETVFSYAHPMFWAPFTLIGDGGVPAAIR
jgi:CHAT domain-containing protein/tetratricopeptide (TPR) repeat protein